MNLTAPGAELVAILARAEAALAAGELEAAHLAMESGAELCTQMQSAGLDVAAADVEPLRELSRRCGVVLARLAQELEADSHRDENHRRGISQYHGTAQR